MWKVDITYNCRTYDISELILFFLPGYFNFVGACRPEVPQIPIIESVDSISRDEPDSP